MQPRVAKSGLPFRTRLLFAAVSIAVATAVWMPMVHWLYRPGPQEFRSEAGVSPVAERLARRHLDLWASDPSEHSDVEQMRFTNPEWDFMGRTFLVLSLANMCLREPTQQASYLAVMDRIIDDTDEFVRRKGVRHFLMSYAGDGQFVQQPVRSIFVDGELGLMMGARRLVTDDGRYRDRMQELVDVTAERMAASPVLSCESYPNERWTFCNTVALAAIRTHEVLDGHDHSALRRDWLARARAKLVHPETGLLCSSYTYEGRVLDGPEGSTIWMAAHCLQIVDPEFAADQYERARRELAHQALGFGWAGEWPASWVGPMDVDSGPVIPILDVSAGSSGQALLGAAAFADAPYYRSLTTTLMFAGFPIERDGRMRFGASNQVGDAVVLYSTVVGPLWQRVRDRGQGGVSP